ARSGLWRTTKCHAFAWLYSLAETRLDCGLGRGAKAAGADMDALTLAFDDHLLRVDVCLEDAVRARGAALPFAGVCVTDVAAEVVALAADFTFRCHNLLRLAEAGRSGQPCPRRRLDGLVVLCSTRGPRVVNRSPKRTAPSAGRLETCVRILRAWP